MAIVDKGDKIGTGSFSIVYRAVHILSGVDVAIKVINKESDDYFDFCDVIENEINILKKLPRLPNIIEFYEVLWKLMYRE